MLLAMCRATLAQRDWCHRMSAAAQVPKKKAVIMEEIYYRRFIMGYLEQKLLPRMQARTAIICSTLISSVLFALMHGVPMAIITAFFLGT